MAGKSRGGENQDETYGAFEEISVLRKSWVECIYSAGRNLGERFVWEVWRAKKEVGEGQILEAQPACYDPSFTCYALLPTKASVNGLQSEHLITCGNLGYVLLPPSYAVEIHTDGRPDCARPWTLSHAGGFAYFKACYHLRHMCFR